VWIRLSACSDVFVESDSLKKNVYLIKDLNIYENLGLWNTILF
jgi:hypothetical protein